MAWARVPPIKVPTLPSGLTAGGITGFTSSYGYMLGCEAHQPDGSVIPGYYDADMGYIFWEYEDTGIIAKTSDVKFGILVDDVFLALQPTEINGSAWFKTGNAVYYKVTDGWVYTTTLQAGVTPIEWQDPDTDDWEGDAYWLDGNPRGSLKDSGEDITVTDYTPDYPRWTSATFLGKYSPKDGATGDRFVGNATWDDNEDGTWTQRSYPPLISGKSREIYRPSSAFYGTTELVLTWDSDADAYVAGTYGSANGWWQLDGVPVQGESMTLVFTAPDPAEGEEAIEGEDIVLTPGAYVRGDDLKTRAAVYGLDWAMML